MASLNRFIHALVMKSGTVSVTPGAMTTGAKVTTLISITGVKASDHVVLEPPAALETGVVWVGQRVVDGGVNVDLYNPTAGTITPTARNWTYKLIPSYL